MAYYSAKALRTAHGFKMVHRDVKPENILLTGRDQARVADFGLVRPVQRWGYGLEKKFLGTPFYASPEQFEGDQEEIDHRTDIYSLGLVFYELLSLVNPLNPNGANLNHFGRDLAYAFLKANAESVPSIRDYVPDISDSLVNAIDNCLCARKEDRYNSLSEFMKDLENTEEFKEYDIRKAR